MAATEAILAYMALRVIDGALQAVAMPVLVSLAGLYTLQPTPPSPVDLTGARVTAPGCPLSSIGREV